MNKSLKEERDRAKRSDILDAAARCFMQHGYDATSVDQIADCYGSTKGLIYYHFRSKTDLFFEVYRTAIQRTIDRAEPIAASHAPGVERLEAMCRGHILGMMQNLAYHHVSKQGVELHMSNALTPDQNAVLRDLITLRDVYERLYVSVIAAGREDGSLACRDPRLAARTLLGALNGFSVWYRPRDRQSQAQREVLAQDVTSLILKGIVAHASP